MGSQGNEGTGDYDVGENRFRCPTEKLTAGEPMTRLGVKISRADYQRLMVYASSKKTTITQVVLDRLGPLFEKLRKKS